MKEARVFQISDFKKGNSRKREKLNTGKNGSVYARGGKSWVYFRYMNQRVRESVGLMDTPENRKLVRQKLDLVIAEIQNNTFEFAKRFPYSKKKDSYTLLETGSVQKNPADITFGEYYQKWYNEMKSGMTDSKIRDYDCIARCHLLPYFQDVPFVAFKPIKMKKFQAYLKSKKTPSGSPLSNKRIRNIFIPLRIVVMDAIDEYGFDLINPFSNLKLPNSKRFRVMPFSYQEWHTLMEHIPEWYKPYFEFAVNTGLRPSEQVALKWSAVDKDYFSVECSRVRNKEKHDLKTESSNRLVVITKTIREILDRQKAVTEKFNSPYVFINTEGRPILQDKMRELWLRVIKKTDLAHRRFYETRHTFASWALASGESPEWVARTLGHVDTAMVYKTYGRYIPNLTRQDGSAFERQFLANKNQEKCGNEISTK